MDQNIRIDEIKAFIGLLPEDQRNQVVIALMTANQMDDTEAKLDLLSVLWESVIGHHIMAAANGRFHNAILGEFEILTSDN